MDKVKAALTDFTSRSGHHDTTVHEAVAPSVQHETVKPHHHEEINTAVDKEVHQDHYHRTVQPVHDREVLPETHTAKLGGVEHRQFDHRDHDTTKRNLIQEQAQFKDHQQVEETSHSRSVAPTVGGEHVHHHIHETIQPVVHKETIQPNVVHTTVPIHEVHHNKAQHHEASTLPAMTMDEFKTKGGSLTGREERFDQFAGVPKNIGAGTGGFGSVRGDKHSSGGVGSAHHQHGDYNESPNHGAMGGAAAGAATGAAASGLAGHHNKEAGHSHRGMEGAAAGAATGAAASGLAGHHNKDSASHEHRGMEGAGVGAATGAAASGLTGHHNKESSGLTGSHNTTGSGMTGSSTNHPERDMVGSASTLSKGHNTHSSNDPTGNVARESNLSNTTSGATGAGAGAGAAGTGARHMGTDGRIGSSDTARDGTDSSDLPRALTEEKSRAHHSSGHEHASGTKAEKPSLMDKLNPKKDADGDGKAGFMK